MDAPEISNILYYLFRINPCASSSFTTPLQHVSPVRRTPNQYHASGHLPHSTNSTLINNETIAPSSNTGQRSNTENGTTQSPNDTKDLKRQLDSEREKVKKLSAQLSTNVS